jgi:zinc protease
VDAAAKRLLAPNRLTWVVVGDRSVVEKKVRALGFGEIAVIDADGKPVASP